MSDDPRGFRRGHPGNRDYSASQQQPGRGGRGPAPQDDRYEDYRQPEPAARPERQPEKQQPAFSAYRPEAYAAPERAPSRAERAEWDTPRAAPPPPPGRNASPAPAVDPFPRAVQSRDPYSDHDQNPADPYAPAGSRGYDNQWQADPYNDQGPDKFPNFYPQDEPPGSDVQSVHDRFFAEADRSPPPPPPQRFAASFEEPEYGSDPASGYGGYPAQRHSGVHGANAGFDERRGEEWDKFEQGPAPAAVRPFHAPATIPDDDLDADFFADEDDYDTEDYPQEKKGGRKKLMAAVLVGAVVTGGGLAYVYKSGGAGEDGSPSLIAADTRPVKEEPQERGGRDFPNGNKLIYDRLGGSSSETAGEEPTRLASGPSSGSIPGVVTTAGTLEERIENALKAQKDEEPTASDRGSNSPDAPRTVRTMTFGPDGTQQAVEPRTQRIAAASSASDGLSAGVVVTTQPTAATSADESPSADSFAASTEAQEEPQGEAARPARVAAVAPAAAPQLSESPGGSGNFFVQIAARNDQDAAMAAFASLQQKYAGVLGNHSPSVRKVDLGEKGVWYRLLVGPVETKSEADQLCEQLKGAGMKSCFSRKD